MIAAVPQRRLAGLDCLLDHHQQLRRQLIQVDLPLQPIAEPRDGLGGVVAAPVEAALHRGLDTAAGRLDHRGHRQCGGGQCRARALDAG
jgi:hypothetical protein